MRPLNKSLYNTIAGILNESREQSYKEFFQGALKRFGVRNVDDLPVDKKKDFFNYVDRNWKSRTESVAKEIEKLKEACGLSKPVSESNELKNLKPEDLEKVQKVADYISKHKKESPKSAWKKVHGSDISSFKIPEKELVGFIETLSESANVNMLGIQRLASFPLLLVFDAPYTESLKKEILADLKKRHPKETFVVEHVGTYKPRKMILVLITRKSAKDYPNGYDILKTLKLHFRDANKDNFEFTTPFRNLTKLLKESKSSGVFIVMETFHNPAHNRLKGVFYSRNRAEIFCEDVKILEGTRAEVQEITNNVLKERYLQEVQRSELFTDIFERPSERERNGIFPGGNVLVNSKGGIYEGTIVHSPKAPFKRRSSSGLCEYRVQFSNGHSSYVLERDLKLDDNSNYYIIKESKFYGPFTLREAEMKAKQNVNVKVVKGDDLQPDEVTLGTDVEKTLNPTTVVKGKVATGANKDEESPKEKYKSDDSLQPKGVSLGTDVEKTANDKPVVKEAKMFEVDCADVDPSEISSKIRYQSNNKITPKREGQMLYFPSPGGLDVNTFKTALEKTLPSNVKVKLTEMAGGKVLVRDINTVKAKDMLQKIVADICGWVGCVAHVSFNDSDAFVHVDKGAPEVAQEIQKAITALNAAGSYEIRSSQIQVSGGLNEETSQGEVDNIVKTLRKMVDSGNVGKGFVNYYKSVHGKLSKEQDQYIHSQVPEVLSLYPLNESKETPEEKYLIKNFKLVTMKQSGKRSEETAIINIRTVLKTAYPNVKFSVRTQRGGYSHAINVSWNREDKGAPQTREVLKLLGPFESAGPMDHRDYAEDRDSEFMSKYGGVNYIGFSSI